MITREEYGWLNIHRSEGFRWIARDKDKGLYVYTTEPEKRECEWRTTKLNSSGVYNDDGYRLFQDIKWEDEKPTKIDDLIKDYESHQVIVGEKVQVVIPQFVADWIEEVKALERPFKLEYLFDTTAMPDDVYDWLDERYGDTDILARAWLDGYEVEKEKLYTVELPNPNKIGNEVNVLMKNGFRQIVIKQEFGDGWKKENSFRLTEAEIKKDFEWAWQFAEEVE